MANSTDTQWEVNDLSLQTYGWNITTTGGDLMAPPSLRGDDTLIPYRPGRVLQPRVPDSRSITFDMWVLGADSDGRVPTSRTMRAEFEKNLKMLRNYFWNQGQPVTLTRRWREADGTLRVARATAIYAGGFAPAMQGSARATFTVEMFLPDPFFYGDEVTLTFPATNQATITPTILGDYESTSLVWEVPGSRATNVRLTNLTRNIYVNVNTNINSDTRLLVDVPSFTAKTYPEVLNGVNEISKTTHSGHTFFMALSPGAQQLRVTSGAGTTAATLKYRPTWL